MNLFTNIGSALDNLFSKATVDKVKARVDEIASAGKEKFDMQKLESSKGWAALQAGKEAFKRAWLDAHKEPEVPMAPDKVEPSDKQ